MSIQSQVRYCQTYRFLCHVHIARIPRLGVLADVFSLARTEASTLCVDSSLSTKGQRNQMSTLENSLSTYIGSTRPSPSVPRPVPSFHPIIFNNLLPTLLSSLAGCAGGGGGVRGRGGPSECRFLADDDDEDDASLWPFSGRGASGWLNSTRLSDARSLYFGNSSFDWLEDPFRATAFWRAISRRLWSLKFF